MSVHECSCNFYQINNNLIICVCGCVINELAMLSYTIFIDPYCNWQHSYSCMILYHIKRLSVNMIDLKLKNLEISNEHST